MNVENMNAGKCDNYIFGKFKKTFGLLNDNKYVLIGGFLPVLSGLALAKIPSIAYNGFFDPKAVFVNHASTAVACVALAIFAIKTCDFGLKSFVYLKYAKKPIPFKIHQWVLIAFFGTIKTVVTDEGTDKQDFRTYIGEDIFLKSYAIV
jgi:hypothetical protein